LALLGLVGQMYSEDTVLPASDWNEPQRHKD
jgi:hypothetical protein